MALSMTTFWLVEDPIRHLRLLPKPSVILGVTLVVTTILLLSVLILLKP
jgi:hypothetical protein